MVRSLSAVSGGQSVSNVHADAPRTAITDHNISRVGSVETIIHEHLKFFKLSDRLVGTQAAAN